MLNIETKELKISDKLKRKIALINNNQGDVNNKNIEL